MRLPLLNDVPNTESFVELCFKVAYYATRWNTNISREPW